MKINNIKHSNDLNDMLHYQNSQILRGIQGPMHQKNEKLK